MLRLSPDGNSAAAGLLDADGRESDVWLYDLTRGTTSRLTFDPQGDGTPLWSPDGTRIVFGSNRSGTGVVDLYEKAASGAGDEQVLLKSAFGKICHELVARWTVHTLRELAAAVKRRHLGAEYVRQSRSETVVAIDRIQSGPGLSFHLTHISSLTRPMNRDERKFTCSVFHCRQTNGRSQQAAGCSHCGAATGKNSSSSRKTRS